MFDCDENKPYLFVSYSHKDSAQVKAIIERLQQEGFNVWWDEGIDPGTEWDENIAKHVKGCSYFVAFISQGYVGSKNCKDELNYSRDLDKDQLLVYLEDVSLPDGMAMRMNRIQSIYWNKYVDDKEMAFRKLFTASGIDVTKCRVEKAAGESEQTPVSVPAAEATASSGAASASGDGKIAGIDKRILFGGIGAAVVLLIGLIFFLTRHQHVWLDATCTEPMHCADCEEVQGEPLGHSFVDATCTSAKYCTVCGEAEGSPVDHVWATATCEAPRTCSVCGLTEGDALEHVWAAATTEAPKTCTLCGITEGNALKALQMLEGYKSSSWLNEKYYVVKDETNKYHLMSYHDGMVADSAFGSYVNAWDSYVSNMDDGCFALYQKLEDGKHYSVVYDANMNVIYAFTSETHWITDYRDGFFWKKDGEGKLSVTTLDVGENGFTWNFGEQPEATYIGNGYFVSEWGDKKQGYYILTKDLLDLTKRAHEGEEVGWNAIRNYAVYDDLNVRFLGVPSKEGVVLVQLVNDSAEVVKNGLYNIITGEFTQIKDVKSWSFFSHPDGSSRNFEFTPGVIQIKVGEMASDPIYRLYDVAAGQYVSEEYYGARQENYPGSKKWYAVKNKNGKWGYLSTETYEFAPEWYDDISIFVNGYAFVKMEDGKYYMVDEDFIVCSEGLEVKTVNGDKVSGSSYSPKETHFAVMDQNDQWHMLIVE